MYPNLGRKKSRERRGKGAEEARLLLWGDPTASDSRETCCVKCCLLYSKSGGGLGSLQNLTRPVFSCTQHWLAGGDVQRSNRQVCVKTTRLFPPCVFFAPTGLVTAVDLVIIATLSGFLPSPVSDRPDSWNVFTHIGVGALRSGV